MPHYVHFLLRHAVIGVAIAAVAVGALLYFDVYGLGSLIARSDSGGLAIGLLVFGLGLTFGSVQMGFAVMLMPSGRDDDDEDSGGGSAFAAAELAPAVAGAKRRAG